MTNKKNILDLSRLELQTWLSEQGLKKYALNQILQWLYRKQADSFDQMTNIAKETRAKLAEHFEIRHLEVLERDHSALDPSTRYLLRLADGNKIESVLMRINNRVTLCVSSQVGCAMGCRFCKTAEMKLAKNLTQGEILGQILAAQNDIFQNANSDQASAGSGLARPAERSERSVNGQPDVGHGARAPCLPAGRVSRPISNIVLMGMGEPFHNYETVIRAIALMTDDFALGLSQRKITVSTVGITPKIESFARDCKAKLALSLNATTDEGRRELMPIARKYPLEGVIEACRKYASESGYKVTFEYVMMAGMNDSSEDVKRLARIASHVPCKINLIPYNEYPGSPYQRPSEEKIRKIFRYLADRHFQVNIRYSKGLDVMAACGQLAVSPSLGTSTSSAPPSPRYRGEGRGEGGSC